MARSLSVRLPAALLGGAVLPLALLSCGSAPEPPAAAGQRAGLSHPAPPPAAPSSEASEPSPAPPPQPPRPAWVVGAHPLPLRADGYGAILPTPPVLADRMLPTTDVLPPPASGAFESTISPVPPDVLARSTWQAGCPVRADQLRYLRMSFLGFDGRAHTGEMLVNADAANAVVKVFGQLFAARFPIEEMRVTAAPELDQPPTGDGDNTSAFVCRPTRGRTNWSAHAYGLAVDLNPFQNPYTHSDVVLPELASAYLDRERVRPGMLLEGNAAVRAFDAAGWAWGGRWSDPVDRMHFSATGH